MEVIYTRQEQRSRSTGFWGSAMRLYDARELSKETVCFPGSLSFKRRHMLMLEVIHSNISQLVYPTRNAMAYACYSLGKPAKDSQLYQPMPWSITRSSGIISRQVCEVTTHNVRLPFDFASLGDTKLCLPPHVFMEYMHKDHSVKSSILFLQNRSIWTSIFSNQT